MKTKTDKEETRLLYTVEQVAELWQYHAETIRKWIRQGRLPGAKKIANSWRIPNSSVEAGPSVLKPS